MKKFARRRTLCLVGSDDEGSNGGAGGVHLHHQSVQSALELGTCCTARVLRTAPVGKKGGSRLGVGHIFCLGCVKTC